MGLALITGASSGIGLELARRFAEHGYDLMIAADDSGIHDAAQKLGRSGVNIRSIQVDLRTGKGVEELYRQVSTEGRPLDVAALNAGVGLGGAFLDSTVQDALALIDLNVRSTVHLAKLVLPDMVRRNSGKVLFTSSIASTMPGSYQAVYHASKSFIQSLSEALHDELRDTGVTVTALMPGPTDNQLLPPRGHGGHPDGPHEPQRRPGRSRQRGLRRVDGRRPQGRRGIHADQSHGHLQQAAARLGQGRGQPGDVDAGPQ